MYKTLSRLAALAASFIFLLTSCEEAPSVITEESPEFSGKMTVLYQGENFDQNGIKVLAEFNQDKTMLDIKLMKVKISQLTILKFTLIIFQVGMA